MTFTRTGVPLQTGAQFDEMQDEEQHLGLSPFQRLAIGMIFLFPNDYMHLACLGAVKRMIWLWMKGPVVNSCRIGAVAVQRISDALIALQSHLPREFHRKGCSLNFANFFVYRAFII